MSEKTIFQKIIDREIPAPLRSQRADAPDLDGDARKIREPAQRIARQHHRTRRESAFVRVVEGGEVDVGHELIQHDAFAEDLADVPLEKLKNLFPRASENRLNEWINDSKNLPK